MKYVEIISLNINEFVLRPKDLVTIATKSFNLEGLVSSIRITAIFKESFCIYPYFILYCQTA